MKVAILDDYFDTLRTLREILSTGYDYSWFVLTQTIIEKEFTLSGSEQNPDITGKDLEATVRSRLLPEVPAPIQAFLDILESPFGVFADGVTILDFLDRVIFAAEDVPSGSVWHQALR